MIMAAPNGARRTRAHHPALPMTPEDIAAEARACADAGASVLHLHVRTPEGGHTLDAAAYEAAIAAIERRVGDRLIIQITSESAGIYAPEQQIGAVEAVPARAVSLALRELIAGDDMEQRAQAFFLKLAGRGTAPQFILYSPDDVRRFCALQERRVIPFVRPFVLFVLGRHGAQGPSSPGDLDAYVEALGGRDFPWMMCAFGARENECAARAIALGGHVRVGFENNLHLPDGSLARSNADLVAIAGDAVLRSGGQPMNAADAAMFMDGCTRLS